MEQVLSSIEHEEEGVVERGWYEGWKGEQWEKGLDMEREESTEQEKVSGKV